jgi:hypothetical protein
LATPSPRGQLAGNDSLPAAVHLHMLHLDHLPPADAEPLHAEPLQRHSTIVERRHHARAVGG